MSSPSPLHVSVDLQRVRDNAKQIARDTNVPIIAVIKSNAYGLGARRVVEVLGDLVGGFYCFSLAEAIDANTVASGKATITLIPHDGEAAADYLAQNARPAVWDVERATTLRAARPVLSVDTGMQRFAAPMGQIDAIIEGGAIDEAFTHATRLQQALALRDRLAGRGLKLHAAATALLDEPLAWLDAVRPGLALYENALRVSTQLFETHNSNGPIGYRGLTTSTGRHGIILAGYSHGLKPGPCWINGSPRNIFECGMQTSFIEIGQDDVAGDEVVLVGDEVPLSTVAAVWGTSRQEVMLRITSSQKLL